MKKEKFSSRCLQFGFIAGLAFLLFGCSDGGSYEPVTASGTVAQGKVVNAKVCADMNYNNSCDEGEPFAISSADGSYNIPNIPAGTPYQLITEGGFDSLTMAAALPMKAPSGASNITPLTTLVVESANPAAMIAILNNLSGGQGFDIDISTASMPPAFLALAKSVEKVLEILATYGLSSPADQTLVFKDIAAAIQSESTNNVSGDLGAIFETAATNIAARDFVA
ncbi:MAG: hypothetical protein Q7U44_12460, partial [Desulfuromonadales bacterium]|nr:hypothetical protein [Desulfuromonadales bacterium]